MRQSNRVLAVRGQVVPGAGVPLTLHAELADGSRLDGQSVIGAARGIDRVWITPADVHATAEATEAISDADLVVLGPGSLYTSLLPNLLIPEIRNALLATRALRAYVFNVATQQGETEGFTLSDHLAALETHGILGSVDVVLANDAPESRAPEGWPVAPVKVDMTAAGEDRPRLVLSDVVDHRNAHHHDPDHLASALLALLEAGALGTPAGVARSA